MAVLACVFVQRTARLLQSAVAMGTCDFLLRLLAARDKRDVYINGDSNEVAPLLFGAGLSLFFQESRDSLRKVTMNYMILSEDHCLALATTSRLDLEVEIRYCSLTDNAAGAFLECLHSDRGPVELIKYRFDRSVLAGALTGDIRVTRLEPVFELTNDAERAVLFPALANNKGLLYLDLQYCTISDETWSVLYDSRILL
jgi:hypothetical protein